MYIGEFYKFLRLGIFMGVFSAKQENLEEIRSNKFGHLFVKKKQWRLWQGFFANCKKYYHPECDIMIDEMRHLPTSRKFLIANNKIKFWFAFHNAGIMLASYVKLVFRLWLVI